MALLSIDTSTSQCSVRIFIDEARQFEMTLKMDQGQAEHLLGMIDFALAAMKLQYTDMTKIAVCVGPGSFTGIRIGLAGTRALALALGIPIVGISALLALSRKNKAKTPTLVLVDARRNELFAELFDHCGHTLGGPQLFSKHSSVPAAWRMRDVKLIGSGAQALAPSLPNAEILTHETAPAITDICYLAQTLDQESAPPAPLYLRQADAKAQNPNQVIKWAES